MNNNFFVYIHISPDERKYIGITQQSLNLRWRNGKGYQRNQYFWRAINKFGWENFKHEILFQGLNEQEAKNKEIELIKKYQSNNKKYGFNLDSGGNSVHRFSEESKRKMSISSTGKKHTEETKQKISKNGKGIKKSKETIEKMRLAWIGEKNHRYGKTAYNAKRIEQISLDGKIIASYESSYAAEKTTGIKSRSIRSVCSGKSKTTGGFMWRFI